MLTDKKIFLFDIDGTLAVDQMLYPGSKELLDYIKEIGGHSFFITNNAEKSRNDYQKKFAGWGIETDLDQFVTASYATCLYLKEHFTGQKLFVMGTDSFLEELRSHGLEVTEQAEEDIAAVVVGFDKRLTYDKVQDACRLLFREEIAYIGTNPDYRCPTAFGFIPDCGGICQMLNCTVGREPIYIGKPNQEIAKLCLQAAGGRYEEAVIIGDRLYTDIACGIRAGIDTVLVLSGEAGRSDLIDTEFPPTYTYENIEEVYRELIKERDKV